MNRMKEQEFYLPSSDSVTRLRCMQWLPDGKTRAALQLSHGMIEHVERYREFAEFLAEQGIAVYGHDHLGHGKTAAPENLGYFKERGGESCLIKDLHRLTVYGKKRFPGVPLFLLGHSMGSFFVRRYLTVYEDGPDGIILTGTGGQSAAKAAAGYMAAELICRWKGDRYRSRFLHMLSIGTYNRRFSPTQTPHDWLTRDVGQARKYGEDALCRFLFTAGAYRDFFKLIFRTVRAEKAGRVRTNMPMLLLSGEADPVGENSRGVRRVYERYDAAGVFDLTVGFYTEARHEILNEINRMEVYEDICQWILGRGATESGADGPTLRTGLGT